METFFDLIYVMLFCRYFINGSSIVSSTIYKINDDVTVIDFNHLCDEGTPILDENNRLKRCYQLATVAAYKCPPKFWCHVGNNNASNFCCPQSKESNSSCELPPTQGYGLAAIKRFYYNPVVNLCTEFIYKGYGGNENNHLSKFDCERACREYHKMRGDLLSVIQERVENPNSKTSSLIPSNTTNSPLWTTLKNVPDSRNDKGFINNHCALPLSEGYIESDSQPFTRWYFNVATKKCEKFNYLGSMGNANNFDTQESCEKSCSSEKGIISITNGRSNLLTVSLKLTTRSNFIGRTTVLIPTMSYEIYSKNISRTQGQLSAPQSHTSTFLRGPRNDTIALVRSEQIENGDGQNMIFNPCTMPLEIDSPLIDGCASSAAVNCPTNTFCQIASDPQQSFCCPIIENDPCNQMPATGSGEVYVGRWFFNVTTKQCNTFLFQGFRGNQNNFLSHRDCQETCKSINPCEFGEPLMQNSIEQRCSSTNFDSCPEGSTCRIIDQSMNTACCPFNPNSSRTNKFGSIPDSPMKTESDLQYNRNLLGNRPNVPQRFHHMHHFQQNDNPCSLGIPLLFNDESVRCGPSDPTMCPATHFCHTGEFIESSVCCARSGNDPCDLPLVPGTGFSLLERYYFDINASACKKFNYTGIKGNENNFLSLTDCRNSCPEYDNPCSIGEPYMDTESGIVIHCSATNSVCPSNYWCHIGESKRTSVCCLKNEIYNTAINRDILTIPMPPTFQYPSSFVNPSDQTISKNVASNSSMIYGYYFNSHNPYAPQLYNERNEMQPMLESSNYPVTSFDNRPRKIKAYSPRSYHSELSIGGIHNSCLLSLVTGNSGSKLRRFYFDFRARQCLPFTYTGKGGNQNNFLTKQTCEDECPVLINPCGSGYPLTNSDGSPILCSVKAADACGSGFYCHIGVTSTTTVCCPSGGDICRLPVSRGNGNAVVSRWYFNFEYRICGSYAYSGSGGNQNNFLSYQDCKNACPEYTSPCAEGLPHISLSGQITHCGASGPSICPATHWCHIGATLETSVCCPGASNPCEQPLQLGSGTLELVRFYYNQVTRTCQQFRYAGLFGNENNFLSQQACESRCPITPNPCADGQPQLDEHQNPTICSVANESSCASDYFCHIGDSERTTACCPGRKFNPCEQPRTDGNGPASLVRYSYSPLTKQCLSFVYTGIGGNQNNFLSKAGCEATCPVVQNPCASGEPAVAENNQYLLCASNIGKTCPEGYWCHIGADITTSLCCPGAGDPCVLPMKVGRGSSELARWYFDEKRRRCMQFQYSGLGGNENNFETTHDCQQRCPEMKNPCSTGDPAPSIINGLLYCNPRSPVCPPSYYCHVGSSHDQTVCCPTFGDPCLAPMMIGTASSSLPRWYFNQNTRQCLPFIYSGEGGNENNFISEANCVQLCPVFHNPCPDDASNTNYLTIMKCSTSNLQACPQTHWCHIGETIDTTVCCPGAIDPCQLPVSPGKYIDNMRKIINRWYFDKYTQVCKPFQYSGYSGNQNNFRTKEECIAKCSVQTTVSSCLMPLSIGYGNIRQQRYYFDFLRHLCLPFFYSGIGGNANNFLHMEDCRNKCVKPVTNTGLTSSLTRNFPCNGPQCRFGKDPNSYKFSSNKTAIHHLNNPGFSSRIAESNSLYYEHKKIIRCLNGGSPLIVDGIRISCLNDDKSCPNSGYTCSYAEDGDAYCCSVRI